MRRSSICQIFMINMVDMVSVLWICRKLTCPWEHIMGHYCSNFFIGFIRVNTIDRGSKWNIERKLNCWLSRGVGALAV